jgi:hypothetical protein
MAALPKHVWFILILFAGVLVVIGGFFVARSNHGPPPDTFATTLMKTSQNAILLSLRQELHLKTAFSGADETSIVEESNGKFLVRGWVDLMAEDGRSSRQSYSVVLHRSADGEWIANDIMVIPR